MSVEIEDKKRLHTRIVYTLHGHSRGTFTTFHDAKHVIENRILKPSGWVSRPLSNKLGCSTVLGEFACNGSGPFCERWSISSRRMPLEGRFVLKFSKGCKRNSLEGRGALVPARKPALNLEGDGGVRATMGSLVRFRMVRSMVSSVGIVGEVPESKRGITESVMLSAIMYPGT